MNTNDNKYSIRRLTIIWGLALPMWFLIGWSAGNFLDQYTAMGNQWCSVIGFCVGDGFGGVAITQEIYDGNIRPLIIVGAFLGWAIGFLLIGYFWIYIASFTM